MDILYISSLPPNAKYGGAKIEQRNKNILEKHYLLSTVNTYSYGRSFLKKIFDIIFSPVSIAYSRKEVNEIKRRIRKTKAPNVFIENSRLGYFAKYAKRKKKKVVVFLHNCEIDLAKQTSGKFFQHLVKKQEKLAVKYADGLICFNERDVNKLSEYYPIFNSKKLIVLPVTLEDKVSDEKELRNPTKGYGLFLGSLFPPNYNGINWFVKNVSPKLEGLIKIVGHKFENCQELARENVEVVGSVDDVSKYLLEADYVVFPIFEGSGMKVKTCEAMMYGKKIFATKEALVGYQKTPNIVECNTKEEFIEEIKNFVNGPKVTFNEDVRKMYLNNYSNQAFEEKIIKWLDQIYC